MSAIILDQEIVHYEVLGRGRPVIFLHGWVGSWRYWIPVMQSASISYRAYALDLYGFGDTAKNPRHYSLAEQMHLLDRFLEQMGILRLVIVGHGLGAILGLMYARQHPAAVDRVMAVGLPLEENMVHSRLRSDSPAVLADWLLSRLPATEAALADAAKVDPQAVQASLAPPVGLGYHELWRTFVTSCLLVHGQNDPAIQSPRLEHLADMPEQMHAVNFEQSGHFPMLDETSKFNRLLIDFLSLSSGESPRDLQLKEEWKRRVR
jgi:pimeloyl-ACP methyl ester carboxylesterase